MMKKYLLYVPLLMALAFRAVAFEDIEDPAKKKAKPAGVVQLKKANIQLASGLDQALSRYQQMDTKAAFDIQPDLMQDLTEMVSVQAEGDRQMAGKLMSYLDNNTDKLREEVTFEDLVVLPVGVKKKLSDNSTITLGILKAEFKPTYAELTVFIRLTTQVNSSSATNNTRDLFFGVEGIKLTKQGGMSAASFKAVLLGDYILPYEGWSFILKGGIDKSITPAPNDTERCYVKFDCGSFEELNIAADIIVPRSKLLPCDINGNIIADEKKRVEIKGLQMTTTGGLRDIVFDSGNITPFALPKHPEYAYIVNNLAFDMSDFRNPASLVSAGFPVGYEGDTDDKWQGLYIGQFSILLPEEFEDADNNNQRVSISAEKIYWDRTGFSGFVGVSGINKKVNARKWTLSLTRLKVGFLQNKFIYGEFGGKIETPINKTNPSPEELFEYEAVIWMAPAPSGTGVRSNYRLTVVTEKTMPFNLWWASGKIYSGSQISLALIYDTKYRFKPYANLSGEMMIGTGTSGDETGNHESGRMIDLGNLKFKNLKIQTEAPYVSVEEFAYEKSDNNLIANFPVQITKFQKYTGMINGVAANDSQIWTEIGFGMALFKDKFSGSSTFVLRSEYNQTTGKLRPKGVTFRDITIKGEITGVSVDGYLGVFEDATRKEIKGRIKVSATSPKSFEIGANVLFANNKTEGYKYGFVDGYALFPDSDGIPLGPVNLYGAGLGVYWNMKPEFISANPSSVACTSIGVNQIMAYCPNKIVPFGIRMMAAIKNPSGGSEGATGGKSAFKARVYLDFALNRNSGINHISIYGNGVIAGDFTGGDSEQAQLENAKATAPAAKGSEDKTPKEIEEAELKLAAETKMKNDSLNRMINTRLNSALAGQNPTQPPAIATGLITFSAGIMLDIPNKSFHLEAEVYMKQGDLSGIGPNGRVGRVEMHFDPTKWYIHAGRAAKPDRIGLQYGNLARIDAYLMIGHGVPQFPAPDKEVLDFFPKLKNKFNGPVCTNVGNGSAFAFGASARLGLDEGGNAWFFKGVAIAGLDVLISNNASCSLVPPNAWFGQGQLYALVMAKAGGKLFGKQITVFNGGVGLYAYLQAPKPFGMDADVCISVPRWISKKKTMCIGVSIGENCTAQPTTCN